MAVISPSFGRAGLLSAQPLKVPFLFLLQAATVVKNRQHHLFLKVRILRTRLSSINCVQIILLVIIHLIMSGGCYNTPCLSVAVAIVAVSLPSITPSGQSVICSSPSCVTLAWS